MTKVLDRIKISNNPKAQAFKYFIPLIVSFWICSFAFTKDITYGNHIGFGTIIICLAILILVYKKDKATKKTIELTEEGILEINHKGQTLIKWNENHQVYYDGTEFTFSGIIPIGSYTSTQIVTKNKRIKIDYPQDRFHENIIYLSHKYLFSSLNERLQKGKRVNFGFIELDANHIYLKNKTYPILDIQNFKVTQGKLHIKFSNGWFSSKIRVANIANLTSLIQIINDDMDKQNSHLKKS